jgi:hypothetical protein
MHDLKLANQQLNQINLPIKSMGLHMYRRPMTLVLGGNLPLTEDYYSSIMQAAALQHSTKRF